VELRRRWIGELEFLEEVNAEKLKEFVFLLSGLEDNNESNYLYVKKQIEFRNLDGLDVGKLEFFKDEEIYTTPRTRSDIRKRSISRPSIS